jgi:hypothetical protein
VTAGGVPPLTPISLGGRAGARAPRGSVVGRVGRRYRRTNPGNVKALRRAVRRITSAEKMFRKVLHLTKPHHTGHVGIKRPRKRSR